MKLGTRAFVLIGAALLLVVFGASLGGEFVWDDAYLVAKNADLTATGGLRRLMTSDLWGGAGGARSQLYHPIPVFTFWLQAQLTALHIVPMRLFNLALHLACGTLLFSWLRAREIDERVAFGASLLFLVHPSVTEPVSWLTGRHDTLGALCILLAVLAWNGTLGRALLASLACGAAFLCKEAFVVAPMLVSLIALSDRRPKRALLALPFLAIGAVFVLRRAVGIASGSAMTGASLPTLAVHYATIAAHYFVQVVTFRSLPTTLSYRPVSVVAAIVVLLMVGVALVFAARDRRAIGLAWFAVGLTPLVLAVPLIGMWGNRYAYVPMIGLFVTAAHLVPPKRAAAWACAGVIAVSAVFTALGARRFHDELALFGADIEVAPDDAHVLYHYGTAVYAKRGCPGAMTYFARATELDPTYARAFRNVAGCALNLRQFDVAERAARAGAALEPESAVHAYHLAAALAARGALDEARAALSHALSLDPSYQPARRLLAQLGR